MLWRSGRPVNAQFAPTDGQFAPQANTSAGLFNAVGHGGLARHAHVKSWHPHASAGAGHDHVKSGGVYRHEEGRGAAAFIQTSREIRSTSEARVAALPA